MSELVFLLTPLREGRREQMYNRTPYNKFLLTPLREGRPFPAQESRRRTYHFYSRPCGRGDGLSLFTELVHKSISTHAPAGGATRKTARHLC